MVKTFNVKGNNTVALAAPAPFAGLPRPSEPARTEPTRIEPTRTAEPARTAAPAPAGDALPPPPPGARPGVLGVLPANVAMATPPADPAPSAPQAAKETAKPLPRNGWIIQVGAYPDEDEAKRRLGTVKIKALRLLSDAEPFTEPTVKDGTTYYRARFAGLDKDQAEAVCKFLKRNDVECVSIKN
jgi:D-alanyl-D-alanine carboxypeptidase